LLKTKIVYKVLQSAEQAVLKMVHAMATLATSTGCQKQPMSMDTLEAMERMFVDTIEAVDVVD